MELHRSLAIAAALLACGVGQTAQAAGPAKVQTTNEANSSGLSGVAQAPLRDFNVVKTQIPDVLTQAVRDPYAKLKSTRCAAIAAEIAPLDEALGPDLDQPIEAESLMDRGKETTFGVMAGAATGVIPFRGWVRRISGADRHDANVQAAIVAGSVRRAYLKGQGEARKCAPPAAAIHPVAAKVAAATPASPPAKKGVKPRYPTH